MDLSRFKQWLGKKSAPPDPEPAPGPEKTVSVNGVPLRAPLTFTGILPTLPGDQPEFQFEPLAHLALALTITPGAVAYDVGASYGVMSALMARLTGPLGQVHSFEANAGVLERARELSEVNGFSARTRFNNVCVGDRSGGFVEFYVVPGYSSVASTRNSEILKFHPEAELVRAPLVSLDDYAREHAHTPDVMKIDIEGSEFLALEGARRILQNRRPDLVIETHGLELLGIGGSVAELCESLDTYGYSFFDLTAGELVTAREYAERYAEPIAYLLASTRLEDPAFVAALKNRRRLIA